MNELDAITDFIFVEHEPQKSDIILVPGGSHPQLMDRASQLFLAGFAPYVLPSGAKNELVPDWSSEAEWFKDIGMKLGVPEEAILVEDQATDTLENAKYSLAMIQKKNIPASKVILVCKTQHARRALLTYKFVFPVSTEFIVCPIPDKRNITRENWFLDQEKIDKVMGEVEKIGKYFREKITALHQRGSAQ